MSLQSLQDFDNFFYWDKNNLSDGNKSEIMAGLMQPSRSLYYSRSWGAGVDNYENRPVSINNLVQIRYNILRFFARRNVLVTNGDEDYPDRRAVTSQNVIDVQNDVRTGNITINVLYYNLFETTPRENVVSVGGDI